MSSQARLALQAIGEQDVYLTQGSQHTFFKSAHRTHSAFGTDWIVVTNNDKNKEHFIQKGSSIYFRIPVDGDLINECVLRIKLVKDIAWSNSSLGLRETLFRIIKQVQLLVHDKIISKLDTNFIASYFELHSTWSQLDNLAQLISYDNALQTSDNSPYVYLHLPLPFWFHRDANLAFPIWALTDANVGIKVELEHYPGCGQIHDIELLTQFAYLSTEEKEKFANLPLEYMVDQPEWVDTFSIRHSTTKVSLPRTHFVKYLLWNVRDPSQGGYHFLDELKSATVNFNGNALIHYEHSKYFHVVSRYQYFQACGSLVLDCEGRPSDELNPVYTYSFSIDPAKTQHKGAGFVSTEKFNQFTLELEFRCEPESTRDCSVFVVRQNFFRFKDGNMSELFH